MLKKWIPFWAIPVTLVFATGTVWLRLLVIRTAYEINETEKMIHRARQERETFQLKVAALRSPRRLEKLAKSKFGLMQPRAEQVIHLNPLESPSHGP